MSKAFQITLILKTDPEVEMPGFLSMLKPPSAYFSHNGKALKCGYLLFRHTLENQKNTERERKKNKSVIKF